MPSLFSQNSAAFIAIFCAIAFFLVSVAGHAGGTGIYMYTDKRGVIHYTNAPTDNRYRPVKLPVAKRAHVPPAKKTARFTPSGNLDPIIQKTARNHGLDPALVKAVIQAESGGQAQAISPKGAMGLMQLMPGTAAELAVWNPFDPVSNIWGGTSYLRAMLDRFNGDIILALAAYNAGPGAVERNGGVPPYPETISYIRKVLSHWARFSNPDL